MLCGISAESFAQTLSGEYRNDGKSTGSYYTRVKWQVSYTFIEKNNLFYIKFYNPRITVPNYSLYHDEFNKEYSVADLKLASWPNARQLPFAMSVKANVSDGNNNYEVTASCNADFTCGDTYIASKADLKNVTTRNFSVTATTYFRANLGGEPAVDEILKSKRQSTGKMAKNNSTNPSQDPMSTTSATTSVANVQEAQQNFESKLNDAIAFGQKLESSFYSMQEVDKNRKELNELSSLEGKFNSVEEIEMTFQKKFNQIAATLDKTVESENTAMMNNASTMNHLLGGNELMGQGIGLAAGLLNQIGAGERKREYEERLRKQKEEQISRLKAMKASQVVEVRKALLETFRDGGLPVSSKSIDNKVVYVFSYSTNRYSFIRDKPKLLVTNVFPIIRNKNGTWPFKNTLIKDLRNHFNNDDVPVILGFFTSENDANSLRDSFLYLASQCDFDLKFSTYSNKTETITNENNDNDFWKN